MLAMFRRLFKEEKGQGMTEYALIIGLIAIAVIAILITMGGKIGNTFSKITNSLPS